VSLILRENRITKGRRRPDPKKERSPRAGKKGLTRPRKKKTFSTQPREKEFHDGKGGARGSRSPQKETDNPKRPEVKTKKKKD